MYHARDAHSYADAIIRQIDPQALKTLSSSQVDAVRRALVQGLEKRHWIDVRGTLPYYFGRLYFVFLLGKDRRARSIQRDHERRRKASLRAQVVFVSFVLFGLFSAALLMLYAIKSALRINIFDDFHLTDIFG